MLPATAILLSGALSAAGAVGGGMLARGGQGGETRIQRKQRKMLDELYRSLKGNGSFSDLFNTDEAAFQKSYVNPAKSMFNNQIAPQIQQNYIASGQQRNSGMEDQMLRAGVDLDQILNQAYMQYQESGKNRKMNALSSFLGAGSGAPNASSPMNDFGQAVAGYASSDAFSNTISDYAKSANAAPAAQAPSPLSQPPRAGFKADRSDWNTYKLNDPRFGR